MVSPPDAPLRAYRIADGRRPILDGTGAALYGGRWNSPGRRVVYAATSYAGALLEKLAQTNIGRIPPNQMWIEITIPAGTEIEYAKPDNIPGWDAEDMIASRRYGDAWYDARRSLVLVVPSVLTPIERNIAINQEHPDFRRIRASEAREVRWDKRLFRR